MTCASAVLGCCRKDKCQVSDNAIAAAWKHVWSHDSNYLRMAAIPEGSWSRCDWSARCCRRLRQLQESCKSYQESTEEFYYDGAWLRSCFVMNLKQHGALSGMGFSAETPMVSCKDGLIYSCVCWWNCHCSTSRTWTLEQLAPSPGTHFWSRCRSWSTSRGASCCRWIVSRLLLRRKKCKATYIL